MGNEFCASFACNEEQLLRLIQRYDPFQTRENEWYKNHVKIRWQIG